MGCHTHYLKLVTNNQEEIVKRVRDTITKSNKYYWFEFKDLNELFNSDDEFIVEIVANWVSDNMDGLFEVNGVWGIYEEADGFCIDEPRISNYPPDIITSSDQMFHVMKTGLTGFKGMRCNFKWNKENEDYIRNNIIQFFTNYPDGIITFG